MLISFTGAQSTGKTTLLNELKKDDSIKEKFVFIDEITRNAQKEGYSINESGDDYTQLRIAYSHLQNIYDIRNKIMDRCMLDCYCYTKYLYKKHRVSKKVFVTIRNLLSLYVSQYSIIFYIEPEFKLVKDGIRSDNERFRDDIVKIFQNTIKKYKINVIQLHGSVEERLKTIYETLERFK